MRRRRALAALALAGATAALSAGCLGGGGDGSADLPPAGTVPAAVAAPVAVAAVPPGGTVTAGPNTPKPVVRALAGSRVVVVAFVVDGPADDARVLASLRAVQSERAGRAVDFFVYRVGEDRFGDLADLLGVAGTPAVAVIGRDRTLVNLWTGLTDAEILRQSISDAADRPAANRGPAVADAGGPVGSPEGIALAERSAAAYADVPGVSMTGSFPAPGAGTMGVEALVRLTDGVADGMSGTFSVGGARFEIVASASASSVRAGGSGCWARLPGAAASAVSTPPAAVELPSGTRVSAPRREGPNDLVDVAAGGTTTTYAIDRASGELREVRSPQGTLTITSLETAPELPDPSPACDDPADALEGLPASLGGAA